MTYKGHKKPRTMANSYRTISTCPLLSKALDLYVKQLSMNEWDEGWSRVQFLGPGMGHELGSLMLTEAINHSVRSNDKPLFVLFLDARSAFDKTINSLLIRSLFLLGTNGHRLLYLDNRLFNRNTYLEWDRKVLGPILDSVGLEQGAVASSDLYTVYNNEHLDSIQQLGLGVTVYGQHISSPGIVDDVALISDDIYFLVNIL